MQVLKIVVAPITPGFDIDEKQEQAGDEQNDPGGSENFHSRIDTRFGLQDKLRFDYMNYQSQ